ncbi:putative signal transducing protein [Roseibium litorale]
MEELVRTNDPVLISFLESLLEEAGLAHELRPPRPQPAF